MKSIKVCYIFVWCILFEIVYMCLSNYRNPIGGVICLILSYALIKKYKNCGKINIYILFFSIMFSIMIVCSKHIIINGGLNEPLATNYITNFSSKEILLVFINILVLYPLIESLINFASHLIYNKAVLISKQKCSIHDKVKIYIFLLIPWFMGFLYFYPGTIIGYDVLRILEVGPKEAASVSPIVFNYLVWFFLKFGEKIIGANFGVALFCFIQMLFMVLAITYVLCWMIDKGISKKIVILIAIFCCFYPIISLYSFTIVKDTGYSVCIFLWIPFLYDLLNEETFGKREILKFIFLIIGTISFRNNGKIIVPIIILLMAFLIKKYRIKILLSGMITICLFNLCIGQLTRTTQSSFAESVGIPLQQIAMVLSENGKISGQDKEFVERILPIDEWIGDDYPTSYAPLCVDNIKFNANGLFDSEFLNSHKIEFLKTYLRIAFKNPILCIKAYMLNTFGFWAWESKNDCQAYIMDIEKNSYGISHDNKLPRNISDFIEAFYSRVPSSEGSAGTFIWIYIFVALFLIVNKKGKYMMVFSPIYLNWLTIMVAVPLAFAFRYVFYYILIFPLAIVITIMIFAPKDNLNIQKSEKEIKAEYNG